jgi:hypothetical protein
MRNAISALAISLVVLISWASLSEAQESTSSTKSTTPPAAPSAAPKPEPSGPAPDFEHAQRIPYPQDGVLLGQGWDIYLNRKTTSICVTGTPNPIGGSSTEFKLKRIYDREQLFHSMEISASGKYSGGSFSASASASFSKTTTIDDSVLNILARIKADKGGTFLGPDIQRDPKTGAITDVNSVDLKTEDAGLPWDQFLKKCGDKFVIAVRVGGELDAIFKLKTHNKDEQQSISATVSAGGFGGSGSGSFSETIKHKSENSQLDIDITQLGGNAAQMAIDADTMMKKVMTFSDPKDFDRRPYELYLVDYRLLTTQPKNRKGSVATPENLELWANLYWRIFDLYRIYQAAILHPELYVNVSVGHSTGDNSGKLDQNSPEDKKIIEAHPDCTDEHMTNLDVQPSDEVKKECRDYDDLVSRAQDMLFILQFMDRTLSACASESRKCKLDDAINQAFHDIRGRQKSDDQIYDPSKKDLTALDAADLLKVANTAFGVTSLSLAESAPGSIIPVFKNEAADASKDDELLNDMKTSQEAQDKNLQSIKRQATGGKGAVLVNVGESFNPFRQYYRWLADKPVYYNPDQKPAEVNGPKPGIEFDFSSITATAFKLKPDDKVTLIAKARTAYSDWLFSDRLMPIVQQFCDDDINSPMCLDARTVGEIAGGTRFILSPTRLNSYTPKKAAAPKATAKDYQPITRPCNMKIAHDAGCHPT